MLFRSEKFDTTTAENKKTLIIIYNNLGGDYSNLKDYQMSLKYYFAGIKKAILENDKGAMAVTYGNIGTNYYNLKLYDQALDAHKQSLKIAQEINGTSDIAEAGLNIGILHNGIQNYAIALTYLDKAIIPAYNSGNRSEERRVGKECRL